MIPAMRICLICKFSFVGEKAGGSNQNQMQQLKIQTSDGTSDQRPEFSGIGTEAVSLIKQTKYRLSVAPIGLVKGRALCKKSHDRHRLLRFGHSKMKTR
jgi:hypothetical protein